MAATTSATPTINGSPASRAGNHSGIAIHSNALSKIANVPLVHAPLNFAYSTIEAHPIFARPYHFGEDVVNQSLKIAEPITSRFNGQLSFLDVQAVKALEFAESKWSYPFKATPQQVAGLPRSVINAYADALQKAWDARVQPQVNNASAKFEELKGQNAFVQRTADAVAQLQVNLAKTVEHLKANRPNGDKAAGEAQGIINNISGEFEKLRQFAAGVPADARKRIDPVIESFGNTYHHLNKEVREGSGPILPRLQKVLTYVQEEALPALRKAAFQPIESGGAAPKVNGSGSGGNSSSSANAK